MNQRGCPSEALHGFKSVIPLSRLHKLLEEHKTGRIKFIVIDGKEKRNNYCKKCKHVKMEKKKINNCNVKDEDIKMEKKKINNCNVKDEDIKMENKKINNCQFKNEQKKQKRDNDWCMKHDFDGFKGYKLTLQITKSIKKEDGRFACLIKKCDKSYKYKSDCSHHILQHLGVSFTCNKCGAIKSTAKECREHVKAQHTIQKCEYCQGEHKYRSQFSRCKKKYSKLLE